MLGKQLGCWATLKKHEVILRKHWKMCCKMLKDGMKK
jgi:hypothetical protein